jgi:retron-type reverse transcriptase
VQTAVLSVLELIFETDLQPEQYAYRADRSALDAVRHIHKPINTGHGKIVDADLSSYFDSIPHAELMRSVARRVVDGAMLHLIKMAARGENQIFPVICPSATNWLAYFDRFKSSTNLRF